jgi:hypothetical protein
VKIIAGLRRREPSIDFETARSAGILGLADFDVLTLAARHNRILVSHDRDTMPAHFSRFITGATSPGLVIASQRLDLGEVIEQILLIWAASNADEWLNRVAYLPL